jgi:capsular exopolysaccharide synthesis family protein
MEQNLSRGPGKGRGVDVPVIDVTTDAGTELTLRDVLGMLKRRRAMLATIFSVGMVGVAVFLFMVTPKFAAKGQLLIDNRASQVRNINSVIATPASDISDVPNEIQMLQSRVLAATVIEQLEMRADPEFNRGKRRIGAPQGALAEPSQPDAATKPDPAANAGQTGPGMGAAVTQGAQDNGVPASVLDAFLKRLEASAQRRSRVIDVTFESTDPKKATLVVNTLLRTYLANQVRYQQQTLTKATHRLQKIVDQLQSEVTAAEIVVQQFRATTRLVESKGGMNITGQQLGELNSQLVQAQAEETAATARLNQMLSLLKSPGSMQSSSEILRSVLIQRLREKETELLRQRSELGSRYGPKHPSIIKVGNEIRDLRQKIEDESNKIVESLSNELAVARAKSAALKKALTRLETKAIDIGKDRNELSELERELETKRNQHQTFLVRLRETSAQQEMIEPTARIVSYAEVPSNPSFPKKGKTLALATMFLALLAMASAIAAEVMRRTVETTNEVEKALRLQPLGILPRLANINALLQRPEHLFSNRGNLSLTQSIRNIRSTLYLSNGSREPNSILVASALPAEGKTEFALSYACFCAANGQRVLLLDCNFTQPTLHEIFSVSNELGVADVLADEDKLREAIRTMPDIGFDYMSSGRIATGKPELLDAAAMKRLLEAVAWDYDVIIIDSSPVLSVANAHVLAKLVDSTIFVVRWRQTRRDLAASAVKRLRSLGVTSISGFILASVNPRKFEGPDSVFDTLGHDDEFGRVGFFRRTMQRLGLASAGSQV